MAYTVKILYKLREQVTAGLRKVTKSSIKNEKAMEGAARAARSVAKEQRRLAVEASKAARIARNSSSSVTKSYEQWSKAANKAAVSSKKATAALMTVPKRPGAFATAMGEYRRVRDENAAYYRDNPKQRKKSRRMRGMRGGGLAAGLGGGYSGMRLVGGPERIQSSPKRGHVSRCQDR